MGETSVQSNVAVLLFLVRYLGCSHCAGILSLIYRFDEMLCIPLSVASIFLAIRASLAKTERIAGFAFSVLSYPCIKINSTLVHYIFDIIFYM